MTVTISMPQLGLTMTEATINEWLKRPGDAVQKDEPLLSVSTDKVDMEIEATAHGILREIIVGKGETVPVGTPLAYIDIESAAASSRGAAAGPSAPPSRSEVSEPPLEVLRQDEEKSRAPRIGRPSEFRASPRAKRRAAELGIDLSSVQGSGPEGRVVEEDLSAIAARRSGTLTAIVSDHTFHSLDLQREVIESAGLKLIEIQPICKTEDDVIARCGEADALLVQWAPITRRVLSSLPKLKGVVRYGIGVDNIDLKAARELGIRVANVPSYCLEEVSNHALALTLSLARRIPQDHAGITEGGWGIGPLLPIPSFLDMTLGLVGFGAIARRVAQKAKVFGFRIVAADPYLNDSVFAENGIERLDLDTLLASADILSLHCPLSPETVHLIRRETIERMKPGVLIVNTARGPIIQEPDLIDALSGGRVLGAGLDVFEREPLAADSPLRRMPNVLLTSHAASVSSRAVKALQIQAAESARDFLENKRPPGQLV